MGRIFAETIPTVKQKAAPRHLSECMRMRPNPLGAPLSCEPVLNPQRHVRNVVPNDRAFAVTLPTEVSGAKHGPMMGIFAAFFDDGGSQPANFVFRFGHVGKRWLSRGVPVVSWLVSRRLGHTAGLCTQG